MAKYEVTACWYETAYVDATDEDEALDKAFNELLPDIHRNGTVDDWVIKELGERC